MRGMGLVAVEKPSSIIFKTPNPSLIIPLKFPKKLRNINIIPSFIRVSSSLILVSDDIICEDKYEYQTTIY